MLTSSEQGGPGGAAGRSGFIWLRRGGLLVAALLLAAAIVMVARQHDVIRQAWQRIAQMPADLLTLWLAALIGSVIVNVALTGLLFSILISRYGRVGLMEMQALIASATLMNYLPLRPGFFSRVAYHKIYNQISALDSTKTILQAMAMSVMVAGYFALAILARSRFEFDLRLAAIAPFPVLGLGALLIRPARIWLSALSVRYVEVLVIAVRYGAAFALLGSPIDAQAALALACISVVAAMVPFPSNGLGLREWAVGLAAPLLTSYRMELGITADLLNRAVEMITLLALGSLGFAFLGMRRGRKASAGGEVNA